MTVKAQSVYNSTGMAWQSIIKASRREEWDSYTFSSSSFLQPPCATLARISHSNAPCLPSRPVWARKSQIRFSVCLGLGESAQ